MTPEQIILLREDETREEVVPASPFARIVARSIDYGLFCFSVLVIQIPYFILDFQLLDVLIMTGVGLIVLGHLLADGILFKCSIGKLLLNIRVVDARTLQRCTWKQSLHRSYVLFVAYGLLWEWAQLCGDRTRRFGDILAGTMVIRNRRNITLPQKH